MLDGLTNTLFVGERNSSIDYSTWVGVVHGAKDPITRIVGSVQQPPNADNATFDGFSSQHHGVTMFLCGDGSVHPIYDEITPSLFRALGTRASRDLIRKKELRW